MDRCSVRHHAILNNSMPREDFHASIHAVMHVSLRVLRAEQHLRLLLPKECCRVCRHHHAMHINPGSMPTEAAPRIDHVRNDDDITAFFLSHRRKCLFSSTPSMRQFWYSREDSMCLGIYTYTNHGRRSHDEIDYRTSKGWYLTQQRCSRSKS